MSLIAPFLLVIPLVIATLCGIIVLFYREIMLAELEGQIDASERMRFPHLSFNYFKIMNLHRKYNPGSLAGRVSRIAIVIGMACVVFMMITIFIAAMTHS